MCGRKQKAALCSAFQLSTEIFISEVALPIDIVVSEMLSMATRIGNGHRDPSLPKRVAFS